MKIKRFWSREPKPLTQAQLDIERKLLPRLKLMGYVFFALSLASFLFVLLAEESNNTFLAPLTEEIGESPSIQTPLIENDLGDEIELSPFDVLNFYVVSLIFASVGTLCFYLTKKKKDELFQENLIIIKQEEETPDVNP